MWSRVPFNWVGVGENLVILCSLDLTPWRRVKKGTSARYFLLPGTGCSAIFLGLVATTLRAFSKSS
jgi:hypothetical protein